MKRMGHSQTTETRKGVPVLIVAGERRALFDHPIKVTNEPTFPEIEAAEESGDFYQTIVARREADRHDNFTIYDGERLIARAMFAEFENGAELITVRLAPEGCLFLDESVFTE